jgi:hypothetical protein
MAHLGEKKYAQDFGAETWREKTTCKTQMKMEDNIKTYKEVSSEDTELIYLA